MPLITGTILIPSFFMASLVFRVLTSLQYDRLSMYCLQISVSNAVFVIILTSYYAIRLFSCSYIGTRMSTDSMTKLGFGANAHSLSFSMTAGVSTGGLSEPASWQIHSFGITPSSDGRPSYLFCTVSAHSSPISVRYLFLCRQTNSCRPRF